METGSSGINVKDLPIGVTYRTKTADGESPTGHFPPGKMVRLILESADQTNSAFKIKGGECFIN